MTKNELVEKNFNEIKKLKIELIKLNTQLKLGSLKQISQIKKTKREIARKLTQINNQITN